MVKNNVEYFLVGVNHLDLPHGQGMKRRIFFIWRESDIYVEYNHHIISQCIADVEIYL